MYLLDAKYVVDTKTKQSVHGVEKVIILLRAFSLEKYFIETKMCLLCVYNLLVRLQILV